MSHRVFLSLGGITLEKELERKLWLLKWSKSVKTRAEKRWYRRQRWPTKLRRKAIGECARLGVKQ